MSEERTEMLSKEKLKFKTEGETRLTKEEEIAGLKSMIECMIKFGDLKQEEKELFFQKELEKINKKYDL